MYLQEVFEVHNELNPLLWDKNNKLHEDVKTKIVNIVNRIIKSIKNIFIFIFLRF